LCSAVMNLHLAQVVNEPMFTVTASIPKGVLPARTLF
jgi:acetamidase/formamidase